MITDPALRSYHSIVLSFLQGLLRFWRAGAASDRLMLALLEFHRSGQARLNGPACRTLEHLAGIEHSSYDSLIYVTNVSHLVYATTLLDTFLSDTTLFLFLLFPQSMGKNQQVSLRTLIDAASRNEALTKAAVMRSREVSYLPFLGRVQFLRDTFGLVIDIKPDDQEALEHYPSIRNSAVHDQGIFDLSLDESGQVRAKQKACELHPTPVTEKDVGNAIRAYERIARIVAQAIFVQVLKQADNPVVKDILQYFTGGKDVSSADTSGSSA